MADQDKEKEEGIPIEFLSREKLNDQEFQEKLNLILDKVKQRMILVLEESMTPQEKKELITKSVEEIDTDFSGIEFSSLENDGSLFDKIIDPIYESIMGKKRNNKRGLTIVGSSSVMEKVKEDKDSVSLLAKAEQD